MSSSESVVGLIEQVRAGNEQAAHAIWDAYFPDLVRIARQHLSSMPRRVADEEDVALSALNSFFQAAEKGRFPDLAGRDDLWRLLSRMTQRKAVDLIRQTLNKSRGGGAVRGDSVFSAQQSDTGEGLAGEAVEELTPELVAIVAENCRQLLESLEDDELKAIAMAKMQGYTNDEIAERSDVALRTVERRLNLIRSKWKSTESDP